MKLLLDNYSDYTSSQSLYLNEGFKRFGHESNMFNVASDSIYDVCDILTPDVLIMSAKRMNHDVIQYLQQADIKLLINVDGLNEANISELIAFTKGNNVSIKFLFTSNTKLPNSIGGINVVKVYNAADTNNIEDLDCNYNVDKAIFIDNDEQDIGYTTSFHVLSCNEDLKDKVDIFLPCVAMRSLFTKYNEIIFKNMQDINQMFLNALCSGTKTYYDNKDDSIKNSLDKMFKQEFDLNYQSGEKITNFKDISSLVQEKHSGDNRAKTILSQIKGA